jgi:hypothetical protein
MSEEQDSPGALTRAYRTVSPGYEGHPDVEMSTIGWAIFLGLVVLLVPLLPFLVLVWVIGKVLDALRGTDEGEA